MRAHLPPSACCHVRKIAASSFIKRGHVLETLGKFQAATVQDVSNRTRATLGLSLKRDPLALDL
jgi:hypothetical protein